jgi:hypothetical protein
VRYLTEKETKPVPTAAEPTSELPKFELIPAFKIPAKAKGMAKAAGIDLGNVEEMAPRINEWAGSVEERLNVIIAAIPNLPAKTIELLKAEAQKQREEMAQRAQATAVNPSGLGGDALGTIGTIAQLAKEMGIVGGGSNPLGDEITKKVIEAGLNQMTAGTRLLEAMQTQMLSKMGAQIVQQTVPNP